MKPSSYRWMILIVFMAVTTTIEIQWLSHAAVARPAEVFYAGQFNKDSLLNIDFLAMSYMLFFLIMSFPASYIIDTWGIKRALTIGAAVSGAAAIGKAIFADNFAGVIICQIILALAQPFILNAVTAVTVRWFPLSERALAAGLSVLAQYIGIIIAMIVTPMMIGTDPQLPGYGMGFQRMLWIYGIASSVSSIALILLIKEHPEDFNEESISRHSFGDGIIHILKNRDSVITLLLFLIGLGIFNAISSMTDSISENAGISDSDGLVGGLMLLGGTIGAIILPALSDRFRKRKAFLVLCLGGMFPGVAGMAFAGDMNFSQDKIYIILLVSSFILGFFVMSAGPIGFQYAAEVSYPAPESASQGMLLWIGQLSGMIFVAGMSAESNAHITGWLHTFPILAAISFVLVLFLKESPAVNRQQ